MDQEPERDAAEAEAVRLYLDAIEVEPVSWSAIEARAARLRTRPALGRYTGPLAAATVAAALLVTLAGRALAPVRTFAGPSATAFSAVRNGPDKALGTAGPNDRSHGAVVTATGVSAAVLAAAPVRWHGRRYIVQAVSLAPAAAGRLLSGQPPRRALWLRSPAPPRGAGEPFHVLALYAVKGRPTSTAIAVLGRFGNGRPSLWAARACSASRSGPAPHPAHA